MGKTFFNPKSTISELLNKPQLLYYVILPLLIFTIGYNILYIHKFIINEPFFNPILKLNDLNERLDLFRSALIINIYLCYCQAFEVY